MDNTMKLRYQQYLINYCLFVVLICQTNCTGTQKKQSTDIEEYYTVADFADVPKIEAHFHINVLDTTFIAQARKDNFRLLTINVESNSPVLLEEQRDIAIAISNTYPNILSYSTTFTVRNWGVPDWQEKTLAYLKDSFEKGAIAVKVWKNIGMVLRDPNGDFVMIDDPRFDPIIDFIKANDIPLIGHLGEPLNAWLPVEEMTVRGDKNYFSNNPEYHMFLHPEFPAYQEQIDARDRMLEKHPDLKFIGAHFASLEWSVDELAERFDRFPNLVVDMSARIAHLQHQCLADWQKVRDFVVKYQDRLIYGTDKIIQQRSDFAAANENLHDTWVKDWAFFVTDEEMEIPAIEGTVKGLRLPKSVVDKIYFKNAEKWFPKIAKK